MGTEPSSKNVTMKTGEKFKIQIIDTSSTNTEMNKN